MGWRNNINQKNIIENAASERCKSIKFCASGKNYKKSLYYKLEVELIKIILTHRKNGRKVSKIFIKTKAKLHILEYQSKKASIFKSSNG